MFKKLITYSLLTIWLAAICSIIFIVTIIGHENGMSLFFSDKKDSMDFAFYDKKQLGRNEKNTDLAIVEEQKTITESMDIKAAMLKQNMKLKATTIQETVKEVVKPKPVEKPKKSTNQDFEIKPISQN